MASGKRASMREGPLADLFRQTEEPRSEEPPAKDEAPAQERRAQAAGARAVTADQAPSASKRDEYVLDGCATAPGGVGDGRLQFAPGHPLTLSEGGGDRAQYPHKFVGLGSHPAAAQHRRQTISLGRGDRTVDPRRRLRFTDVRRVGGVLDRDCGRSMIAAPDIVDEGDAASPDRGGERLLKPLDRRDGQAVNRRELSTGRIGHAGEDEQALLGVELQRATDLHATGQVLLVCAGVRLDPQRSPVERPAERVEASARAIGKMQVDESEHPAGEARLLARLVECQGGEAAQPRPGQERLTGVGCPHVQAASAAIMAGVGQQAKLKQTRGEACRRVHDLCRLVAQAQRLRALRGRRTA